MHVCVSIYICTYTYMPVNTCAQAGITGIRLLPWNFIFADFIVVVSLSQDLRLIGTVWISFIHLGCYMLACMEFDSQCIDRCPLVFACAFDFCKSIISSILIKSHQFLIISLGTILQFMATPSG